MLSQPQSSSRPLRWARAVLQFIHCFSLDAVLVIVSWHLLVVLAYQTKAPSIGRMLALGVAVWLVYTLDRWLDGQRIDGSQPHTMRHRFHAQYSQTIAIIWIGTVALECVLLWLVATPSEWPWILIGILGVAIYFRMLQLISQGLDQQSTTTPWFWLKELSVGSLLGFGVMIPIASQTPTVPVLITTVMVAFMFMTNCVLVSKAERELDQAQGFPSLSQNELWMKCLFTGTLSLAIVSTVVGLVPQAIGVGVMVGLPAMLLFRKPVFQVGSSGLQHDAALVLAAFIGLVMVT